MVSTAQTQTRRTIDRYLRLLAAGDAAGVLELFTDDGVVRSPMNGEIPAREFYPELAATTARSEITPVDVYLSTEQPNCAAVRFRYDWRLPDDTATAFDCVDMLTLDETGRITELRIVYDTHPLRMAWQASLPAP
ncbi:nuclear transport factor 2 family protein [Actinoalloteichus hymeniacidonis]|uniref:Ketosteroid isomerase-like protein n=1 Tax=Actinoalloteichus hymeniacidonis TaxID=340345 RepID=A0AAC9HKP6_9PSEU|nr:nuclear transport factor 2 family protein [Actinoalloteichus hymeniacidonis]AOS60873.1 ketosteroid isomerase-like protein [Actinoalloteichus hymeniacidonis]MBB5911127.1 ketosteroid isomerase-like protein [Actinoalloteichus hymeniacidonis]